MEIIIPKSWVSNINQLSVVIRGEGYTIDSRSTFRDKVVFKIEETLNQSQKDSLVTLIKARSDIMNDIMFS